MHTHIPAHPPPPSSLDIRQWQRPNVASCTVEDGALEPLATRREQYLSSFSSPTLSGGEAVVHGDGDGDGQPTARSVHPRTPVSLRHSTPSPPVFFSSTLSTAATPLRTRSPAVWIMRTGSGTSPRRGYNIHRRQNSPVVEQSEHYGCPDRVDVTAARSERDEGTAYSDARRLDARAWSQARGGGSQKLGVRGEHCMGRPVDGSTRTTSPLLVVSHRPLTTKLPLSASAAPSATLFKYEEGQSAASGTSTESFAPPPPQNRMPALETPSMRVEWLDTSVGGLGPIFLLTTADGSPPSMEQSPPLPSALNSESQEKSYDACGGALWVPKRALQSPPCVTPLTLAQMTDEADLRTRELESLYTKLELAEGQMLAMERQISVAAETRAASLMQQYKTDERQRRETFQRTLDTLRDENRELMSKLEAATRGSVEGAAVPVSLAVEKPPSTTGGAADLARQVQAVEVYWRDRLRAAERHWEDVMTSQSHQRREALNQVDTLVRTVEELQEEVRHYRQEAGQLNEENLRLRRRFYVPSAASPSRDDEVSRDATGPDVVERLWGQLRAQKEREEALLIQVEANGEETVRVRTQYEAVVQRLQRELEMERARGRELVQLYGSQVESLHRQLRQSEKSLATN